MSQFDFSDYFQQLKTGVKDLALKEWTDCKDAAIKDGCAFLEKTKNDLQHWSEQVALKQLSQDDFEWNVQGRMDVAELRALKEEGLAQVRLERFRDAVVGLVIGGLLKAL